MGEGKKDVRVGRPRKAPRDRAQSVKVWLSGRDAIALGALARARRLSLPQYVVGLVRDDLARAASDQPSGPITDERLFEITQDAFRLVKDLKAELKKAKGGRNG